MMSLCCYQRWSKNHLEISFSETLGTGRQTEIPRHFGLDPASGEWGKARLPIGRTLHSDLADMSSTCEVGQYLAIVSRVTPAIHLHRAGSDRLVALTLKWQWRIVPPRGLASGEYSSKRDTLDYRW
jgi:hypothetical protein